MNKTAAGYRDSLRSKRLRRRFFQRSSYGEILFRQNATVATVGELDRSAANPYPVLLSTVETVETVV